MVLPHLQHPGVRQPQKGIGIAITLEKEAPVSSLLISSDNTGGNVQIRATSADKPTDGKVLAEGPLDGDTQLKFDSPVTTDTLVLWFTELPNKAPTTGPTSTKSLSPNPLTAPRE